MILDAQGRPLRPVTEEIAGILDRQGRWQDVGGAWAGQLLRYSDRILWEEGGGGPWAYDLYDQILSDDQVWACLQQRFGVQQEFEVFAGDESRRAHKAARELKENLNRLRWDLISYQVKFGFFYGFSVAEIMWTTEGDRVWIKDILVRDRRRFRFDTHKRLRLLTPFAPQGLDLSQYPAKFWVFAYGGTHGDQPDGIGLAHYLYWPVTFKRQGVRFWLYALERHGTAIPVGYYPPGTTEEERQSLVEALARLKRNSVICLPEEFKLETLGGQSGADSYEALTRWANEAIAKVILTNTLTVEQGSNRAQAQVHQHETETLVDTDNDLLCESFNATVARWWTWFNYGDDVAPPKLWRQHESIDTKELIGRDRTLFDMGYIPTPEYIRQTYGEGFAAGQGALNSTQVNSLLSLLAAAGRGDIPVESLRVVFQAAFPLLTADQIDSILQPMVQQKQEQHKPLDWGAILGGGEAPPPEMAAPLPTPDLLAERLRQVVRPILDQWLTQIAALLPGEDETTPDWQQAIEQLEDLYPLLAEDAFIETLAQALYAAQLAGLAEVQNESNP